MVKDIFDGIGHRSGKGTCGPEKAGPSKRQVKLSILASFREVRVAPSQYHSLEKKLADQQRHLFQGVSGWSYYTDGKGWEEGGVEVLELWS